MHLSENIRSGVLRSSSIDNLLYLRQPQPVYGCKLYCVRNRISELWNLYRSLVCDERQHPSSHHTGEHINCSLSFDVALCFFPHSFELPKQMMDIPSELSQLSDALSLAIKGSVSRYLNLYNYPPDLPAFVLACDWYDHAIIHTTKQIV